MRTSNIKFEFEIESLILNKKYKKVTLSYEVVIDICIGFLILNKLNIMTNVTEFQLKE